jgi:hypothetical protein
MENTDGTGVMTSTFILQLQLKLLSVREAAEGNAGSEIALRRRESCERGWCSTFVELFRIEPQNVAVLSFTGRSLD